MKELIASSEYMQLKWTPSTLCGIKSNLGTCSHLEAHGSSSNIFTLSFYCLFVCLFCSPSSPTSCGVFFSFYHASIDNSGGIKFDSKILPVRASYLSAGPVNLRASLRYTLPIPKQLPVAVKQTDRALGGRPPKWPTRGSKYETCGERTAELQRLISHHKSHIIAAEAHHKSSSVIFVFTASPTAPPGQPALDHPNSLSVRFLLLFIYLFIF